MKPSITLDLKRSSVLNIVRRFCITNPCIFGSVLYGADQEGIDLDLLVDVLPARHDVI